MNTHPAAQWLKALLPPTCAVHLEAVTVEAETLQLQRKEAAPPPRHAHWVAIDDAVHARRAQGRPVTVSARRLAISRPTVDAYLRRDAPPGPRQLQRRPAARVLTPYIPSLIRRWRDTQADRVQRWREMQALGSPHSARTVGRFSTPRRRAADAGHPPASQGSPDTRPQGPPLARSPAPWAARRHSGQRRYRRIWIGSARWGPPSHERRR